VKPGAGRVIEIAQQIGQRPPVAQGKADGQIQALRGIETIHRLQKLCPGGNLAAQRLSRRRDRRVRHDAQQKQHRDNPCENGGVHKSFMLARTLSQSPNHLKQDASINFNHGWAQETKHLPPANFCRPTRPQTACLDRP
jgi:hypothetical protein